MAGEFNHLSFSPRCNEKEYNHGYNYLYIDSTTLKLQGFAITVQYEIADRVSDIQKFGRNENCHLTIMVAIPHVHAFLYTLEYNIQMQHFVHALIGKYTLPIL